MFNKLFCKHQYKYYHTTEKCLPLGVYPYYVFQFVCTKCGKTTEVWENDIEAEHEKLESSYKKYIALGGEPVESQELLVPRRGISTLYISSAATLLIDEYLKRGIDLRQLNDL